MKWVGFIRTSNLSASWEFKIRRLGDEQPTNKRVSLERVAFYIDCLLVIKLGLPFNVPFRTYT